MRSEGKPKNRRRKSQRQALALSVQHLVKKLAGDFLHQHPSLLPLISVQELQSGAWVAVMRCTILWDKSRGIRFVTYAHAAIERSFWDEANRVIHGCSRSRGDDQGEQRDGSAGERRPARSRSTASRRSSTAWSIPGTGRRKKS